MLHNYSDNYNNIILEPLEECHIEKMRKLRNRNRMSFINSNLISETEQITWFKQYVEKKDDYMFSIMRKSDNQFVGVVGLYNVCKSEAEFGRLMIDKEIVNEKGYGYDSVLCACSIGFHKLNLEKIILEVWEENIPALKTYLKAGFMVTEQKKLENSKVLKYMELSKEVYEKLNLAK